MMGDMIKSLRIFPRLQQLGRMGWAGWGQGQCLETKQTPSGVCTSRMTGPGGDSHVGEQGLDAIHPSTVLKPNW